MLRRLPAPAIYVLVILGVWLLVSLALWLLVPPFAKAGPVKPSDANAVGCPVDGEPPAPYYTGDHGEGEAFSLNGWAVDEAEAGTWGMDPSMDWGSTDVQPMDPKARNPFKGRRLKVLTNPDGSYSTCYVIKGNIVSGELWGEEDQSWATGSDQDMTYYMTLNRSDSEPDPPITNRERRNLRYWQPTGPKVSEILGEAVQPDQRTLPPVCMDKDWVYDMQYERWQKEPDGNTNNDPDPKYQDPKYNTVRETDITVTNAEGQAETWPKTLCQGPNKTISEDPGVPAEFQGALVLDVQHGYKEIHPIRRSKDLRTEGHVWPELPSQDCRTWDVNCDGYWPPEPFPFPDGTW
jgi:hypothetical protein